MTSTTQRANLTNPHPAVDVAIVGPLTLGVPAHKAVVKAVNNGTPDHPLWHTTITATCTRQEGRAVSYAWASLNGAQPCRGCWDTTGQGGEPK